MIEDHALALVRGIELGSLLPELKPGELQTLQSGLASIHRAYLDSVGHFLGEFRPEVNGIIAAHMRLAYDAIAKVFITNNIQSADSLHVSEIRRLLEDVRKDPARGTVETMLRLAELRRLTLPDLFEERIPACVAGLALKGNWWPFLEEHMPHQDPEMMGPCPISDRGAWAVRHILKGRIMHWKCAAAPVTNPISPVPRIAGRPVKVSLEGIRHKVRAIKATGLRSVRDICFALDDKEVPTPRNPRGRPSWSCELWADSYNNHRSAVSTWISKIKV